MPTGRVMTVRGPIAAEDLGITLMHEHLFIDLSFLWDSPNLRLAGAARRR